MDAALEHYLKSSTYRRDRKSRRQIIVELYKDGKWESYPAPNFETSRYEPRGATVLVADAEEMRRALPTALDEVYG